MIQILSDSCSDLTRDLLKKHQISILPLNVFIDNQTFHDGEDISIEKLFQKVSDTGELPKTSAPSLMEFNTFFSPVDHGIYIGISSELSATMNVAIESVNTFVKKDIRLVDSKNLSTGIGLLVLKAAELRDQGLNLDEIEKEIRDSVPKVRTAFVINTLEYLYKGGRCSAMENIMGSLLHIRPIINVRPDGTLGVKEKISGSRNKALNALLTDFDRNKANIDLHRVFITHSCCEADAETLRKSLLEMAPIEETCITVAGATIASHCGPATIGILYLLK
jgi:DegV family protein with EDD domain